MFVSLLSFFFFKTGVLEKKTAGVSREDICREDVSHNILSHTSIIVSAWIYPYGAIGNPQDLNGWEKTRFETNWLRSTRFKKSIHWIASFRRKKGIRDTPFQRMSCSSKIRRRTSTRRPSAAIKERCWGRWSITRLAARRKTTNLTKRCILPRVLFYFPHRRRSRHIKGGPRYNSSGRRRAPGTRRWKMNISIMSSVTLSSESP